MKILTKTLLLLTLSMTNQAYSSSNQQTDDDYTNVSKVIVINQTDADKVSNKSLQPKKQGMVYDTKSGDKVRVIVEDDNGKINKQISINGKALSDDEIKDFEACGKLKIIHLDKEVNGFDKHKMIFVNVDDNGNESNETMEMLINPDSPEEFWKRKDGKHVKIITNGLYKSNYPIDMNNISLGFMTIQHSDGLHVGYLLPDSDAKRVGLQENDLIKKINNIDFSNSTDFVQNLIKLKKFKEGEIVDVAVERDGKLLNFEVKAQKQDFSFMRHPPDDFLNWLERSNEVENQFSKQTKVMVFNADDDFKLNTDDINIVFPDKLGDMNFFISDGKSTAKLLGKQHEMSSLSSELAQYFNTSGGVLVLHVDKDNAFALKDGDVIKSIDGEKVTTPKDVIKQLLKADKQEDIKIKIVRHKRNKTLKYNK